MYCVYSDMNQENKVKVTFRGHLANDVGSSFELFVKSASEAIHAVNTLTDGKLFRSLNKEENKKREYRVLINGEDFTSEKPLNDESNAEAILTSSLAIKSDNIKTVEIIPLIEFGDNGGIFTTILGVLLIIVAVVLVVFQLYPLAAAVGMVGLGLLAAGITALLSKPPQFEDFREIAQGGKFSYLFNGPQNTSREGGPVPIGYGRLLVGSQTVSASYEISQYLNSGATGSYTITGGSNGGVATRPTWLP